MKEEIVINLETVLTAVFFLGMFTGIFLCLLLAKINKFFQDRLMEVSNER